MSGRPVCLLGVACDADPDALPPYRHLPAGVAPTTLWRGVLERVPKLREALSRTRFARRYGRLPITWLLRADRQVAEVWGDPSWCATQLAPIWDVEVAAGSELGWHPHLYRWDDTRGRWIAWLGQDDDLAILNDSLEALRRHFPVTVVRTGWDYESNAVAGLLSSARLEVDASPVPGSVQRGGWWTHDWEGTPRLPFLASRSDYRRPARQGEAAYDHLTLPTLVLHLPLPLQAVRWALRRSRSPGSPPSFRSAGVHGQFISRLPFAFRKAVAQHLHSHRNAPVIPLVTYFHPNEILTDEGIRNFAVNLDSILSEAERRGVPLEPMNLTPLARRAREALGLAPYPTVK